MWAQAYAYVLSRAVHAHVVHSGTNIRRYAPGDILFLSAERNGSVSFVTVGG